MALLPMGGALETLSHGFGSWAVRGRNSGAKML